MTSIDISRHVSVWLVQRLSIPKGPFFKLNMFRFLNETLTFLIQILLLFLPIDFPSNTGEPFIVGWVLLVFATVKTVIVSWFEILKIRFDSIMPLVVVDTLVWTFLVRRRVIFSFDLLYSLVSPAKILIVETIGTGSRKSRMFGASWTQRVSGLWLLVLIFWGVLCEVIVLLVDSGVDLPGPLFVMFETKLPDHFYY